MKDTTKHENYSMLMKLQRGEEAALPGRWSRGLTLWEQNLFLSPSPTCCIGFVIMITVIAFVKYSKTSCGMQITIF